MKAGFETCQVPHRSDEIIGLPPFNKGFDPLVILNGTVHVKSDASQDSPYDVNRSFQDDKGDKQRAKGNSIKNPYMTPWQKGKRQ
jgi:hypothetical protein